MICASEGKCAAGCGLFGSSSAVPRDTPLAKTSLRITERSCVVDTNLVVMRYQLTILRSLCYLCVIPIILTLPRRTTRFSARSFTHFSRCCTYMYNCRGSIVIGVSPRAYADTTGTSQ